MSNEKLPAEEKADCEKELEKRPVKWSWVEFFKSKCFWAMVLSVAHNYFWFAVFSQTIKNQVVDIIVAGTVAAAIVFFIFSRPLETAIANMKMSLELKKELKANADAAGLINAFKNGGKTL
jgi:hypothetical protein